jgi:hypothetical protein
MKRPTIERCLHWSPRVLGLAFAGFLSVFALDVFGEGLTIPRTIIALAIHLVPAVVVLAAVAISWRRGWVGALLFLTLGTYYVVGLWGRFHWSAYVAIAGPLVLLGLLFALDWGYEQSRRRDGGRTLT